MNVGQLKSFILENPTSTQKIEQYCYDWIKENGNKKNVVKAIYQLYQPSKNEFTFGELIKYYNFTQYFAKLQTPLEICHLEYQLRMINMEIVAYEDEIITNEMCQKVMKKREKLSKWFDNQLSQMEKMKKYH